MTVWTDNGLTKPSLVADGAPATDAAFEYLLGNAIKRQTPGLTAAQNPAPITIASDPAGGDNADWLAYDGSGDVTHLYVAGGATKQGLGPSVVHLVDENVHREQSVALTIDSIFTDTPTHTMWRTGIHSKMFCPPDNGGDSSAGLFVQTGGGSALSAYKVASTHRPAGFVDYSDSEQGAFEAGTSDGSHAILGIAGSHGGTKAAVAVWARVDNAASFGFLSQPGDNVFDTRAAFLVGERVIAGGEATVAHVKSLLSFNGDLSTVGALSVHPQGADNLLAATDFYSMYQAATSDKNWHLLDGTLNGGVTPNNVLTVVHLTAGGLVAGDLLLETTGAAYALRSPNGHKWRLAISDGGAVTWTDVG